jgi:AcrR family transcriptional regulator
VDLVWGTRPAPSRGPAPSFSAEALARAAIALADAKGLEGLTMARLARAVGLRPMSLYRYVHTKAELVALMLDQAFGARLAPGPGGGWRRRLEAWAVALRGLFEAHPWALAASAEVRVMGPNELGWLEAGLATLDETKLSPGKRMEAVLAVVGQVRAEAHHAGANPGPSPAAAEGWGQTTLRLVSGRPADFPRVRASLLAGELARLRGGGRSSGVRLVLDGIEADTRA